MSNAQTRRTGLVLIFLLVTVSLFIAESPSPRPLHAQETESETESGDTERANAKDGAPGPDDVLIYPIVGSLSARYLKKIRKQLTKIVEEEGYTNIILKIDTPGGDLFESKETAALIYDLSRRRVNGRQVLTIAYVPTGGYAYSAGTLLALACSEVEMGENSRLGDVEPIDMFGNRLEEKIQTVVRKDLISYGSEHGYPEELMAAMVTKEREVYQVFERQDTGSVITKYVYKQDLVEGSPRYVKKPKRVVMDTEILTINETEALEYGIIDRVFATQEQLIDHYKLYGAAVDLDDVSTGGRLHDFQWGWLKRFLAEPLVQFLLIVLGVLGLVIELNVPGFGVPGVLGALFFVIFFAGAVWVGTASWFDISLFVVALVLLGVEAFVIPGFGIAGVVGLFALISSLILALVGDPGDDTRGTWGEVFQKTAIVFLGLGASIVVTLIVLRFLPAKGEGGSSGWISRTAIDGTSPGTETSSTQASWLHRKGQVVTDLRPAGKVDIDGEFVDVVADGEFIAAGTRVEVTEIEGNRIVVRPIEDGRSSV